MQLRACVVRAPSVTEALLIIVVLILFNGMTFDRKDPAHVQGEDTIDNKALRYRKTMSEAKMLLVVQAYTSGGCSRWLIIAIR